MAKTYTIGQTVNDPDTGELVRIDALNDEGLPTAVTPVQIDTGKELTGADRILYALAFDNPERQLDAIKGLGKQGVIENGKVYVVEGGKKYEPDSPELNWTDALDLPAVAPEAALSGLGEVFGPAGAGAGGAAGTLIRHGAARLAGVTPSDAPFPAYEIGESAALNAAAPKVLRAIGSGVRKIAKAPARMMAGPTGDALLEQTFNVPAQSVRQAVGTGGRKLQESVARGDTMMSAAARLAKAPSEIVDAAGKKFGELKDKAIRSDVWADVDPISARFDSELEALKVPDATGEKIIDVLPDDLAVIEKAGNLVSRLKALAAKGKAEGLGGVSATELEQYRKSLNTLANSRNIWDKPYDKLGAGDRVLRGLYGEIKDELERSADRLYEATGDAAANQWRQAKTEYRMAREFADQFAQTFGVDVKDIGDNVVYNLTDAGQVAQTLRNITNAPKEAAAMKLRDLKRIMPQYGDVVDEVFQFAEAKPWMQSAASKTGSTNKPWIMASSGAMAGHTVAPYVGAVPGAIGGYYAASKLAPQSAIEWLPGIGETGRKVAGAVGTAARAMAPIAEPLAPIGRAAAKQAVVETARRNIGTNEAQAGELREIGKLAPAMDAPESLVRSAIEAQKAPVLEYVNTHYRQLLDKYRAAGMADDDAAMAVVRDIGGRKKNGGRVAPFIENIRRDLRTAGYDVKDADVIQFMSAIQE